MREPSPRPQLTTVHVGFAEKCELWWRDQRCKVDGSGRPTRVSVYYMTGYVEVFDRDRTAGFIALTKHFYRRYSPASDTQSVGGGGRPPCCHAWTRGPSLLFFCLHVSQSLYVPISPTFIHLLLLLLFLIFLSFFYFFM